MSREYQSYKNLPPLAGLTDFARAAQPGLSVEECVRRLKRFHFCFWRLHQAFIAHLAEEPIYELKMAWSLHGHLAAENDTNLRNRVGEMREPPLGFEKIPHPALAVFFDEILCTPSTPERVLGFYEKAVPALIEAMRRYMKDTHPLADAPSIRLCRIALMDLEDIAKYGAQAVAALVTKEQHQASAQWLALLDVCLAAAGGIDGIGKASEGEPTRHYSSRPFVYQGEPRRDERFPDPYNMGVNAEAFLYDEKQPAELKVLMMFYKRIREIDVPEMMSSIITETKGKPWGYYRDMTRQLWDEARHGMMGEVGFVSLGLDWPKLVMVNSTWSRSLNLDLSPKERHAVLYFIEQGLMPKTGKRHEWEVAREAHSPISTTFQDFDWADEVLHARIGRDWYVADMPSPAEAVHYGDQTWSRAISGWQKWKDEGLTAHRNWWPDLYRAYCRGKGISPDPAIEAYGETYDGKRADLRQVAVST
ncbi:MAG TPA: hypothetical protein VHY09_08090 [Candidatus Methylacidiphilales bacterium]|jgi:hypothetical protein|nr:hypothetical protein [Candidatus Methylacidiphilales bacterium]